MNIDDYKSGGSLISRRHGEQIATKLTEAKAREIYNRKALGKRARDNARLLSKDALAEKFDLHPKSVWRIACGKRGTKPYAGRTMDDVRLIREAIAERDRLLAVAAEHTSDRIAADYGVSKSLVDGIFEGRIWSRVTVDEYNTSCAG